MGVSRESLVCCEHKIPNNVTSSTHTPREHLCWTRLSKPMAMVQVGRVSLSASRNMAYEVYWCHYTVLLCVSRSSCSSILTFGCIVWLQCNSCCSGWFWWAIDNNSEVLHVASSFMHDDDEVIIVKKIRFDFFLNREDEWITFQNSREIVRLQSCQD